MKVLTITGSINDFNFPTAFYISMGEMMNADALPTSSINAISRCR
jgi:hypothetical protein